MLQQFIILALELLIEYFLLLKRKHWSHKKAIAWSMKISPIIGNQRLKIYLGNRLLVNASTVTFRIENIGQKPVSDPNIEIKVEKEHEATDSIYYAFFKYKRIERESVWYPAPDTVGNKSGFSIVCKDLQQKEVMEFVAFFSAPISEHQPYISIHQKGLDVLPNKDYEREKVSSNLFNLIIVVFGIFILVTFLWELGFWNGFFSYIKHT